MDAIAKKPKLLGGKAYGSIGHLPDSRMGPKDHHVHDGQARICTVKARDRHDRIIVQEKLDGSCVAVLRQASDIVVLTRAGYEAMTSPYPQHHLWHDWATTHRERFLSVLNDGERLCGEWLAQAHGTRYHLQLREPFVAFDLITGGTGGGKRLNHDEFMGRLTESHKFTEPIFNVPKKLSDGTPISISEALAVLGPFGHYGALDEVEGVVYRVERFNQKKLDFEVDFLAKYVKPSKQDGTYLPEISGKDAIWNWHP